ncbi:MAG: Do family serine endopeptidase, partial [Hyphomicrobiaceae bacterium]|nr:Do family serine endopeptidase [Hyphomicrobiaceae bacterium]
GLVVTNNHVIEDADEIEVILQDGTKLPARLIGRDDKTDIALLQVESDEPLTPVEFGSSEELRVGDWVLAIGNPFGLGGTVTLGIVSAMNRDIGSGPYDAFIQTDAAINRGNSGGPLFNMAGEVIGVNTAIISPSGGSIGIGFAVPSDTVLQVIAQLREFGETRRGWLGVNIQEVTDDIAESLGLDGARGALVAGVTPGGPADAAGIERGDVIISFAGDEVPTARALPRMVASTPVGTEVEVVIVREGARETLSITLGRLEDGERVAGADGQNGDKGDGAPMTPEETRVLGLTLEELSDEARSQLSLADEVEGVLVREVDADSVAYSRGIRPGHVILEVGERPVAEPADVIGRIEDMRAASGAERREQVLFLIQTAEGQIRFIPIPLDE